MMIFCVVYLLLCCTCCHGRPRGILPSDEAPRDLRGRLNGNRGGAAGRLGFKAWTKRDPVLLSPASLPKPLFGHAVVWYQASVYISGGCESLQGQIFEQNTNRYKCSSLSGSFYKFDPMVGYGRGLYTTLPDLPRPRHRHTSTIVSGKIWLVGGRDVNDDVLDTIDVYDIAANAWSSIVIPEQFRTSDHASFSNKRFLYIAGGFGQGYNETNVVYRIDTETFRIEIVASLPVARGAIASTQTSDYAFLAGGYKNCDASRLVERFDFATGLWTRLPSLNEPRGNANLVVLNGIVIIYGGERDMASGCNATHSEKVDWNISVEVLGSDVWKLVNTGMEIPRFQSASVAIDTTIFTFGGHLSYESDCRCYPNSDGVMSYRQLYHQVVELVDAPTNVPTSLPPNLTVSNDRCADGVKLEVVPEGMNGFAPVFGTTVGASVDLDAPTCNGVAVNHPGVWFQVTSPTDGTLTAQSCGRFSDFDIQLSVYQGSCHQLMCVAADDDSCGGNQARVTWEGERGQVYYLLVHGWVGVGNYQVSVQVREPPNDTCNYAQGPLPIGSSVEGSTTFASRDMMVQTCGGISYGAVEGVWYSVIGTGNVLVADSCADATDYDTKIHVFAGTCGDLECIGGNDNSAECGSLTNHQSLVRWQSEVGMKYWIYVHGFDGFSSRGYFVLTLSDDSR